MAAPSNDKFYITGGNVGIGHTSPSYRLDVRDKSSTSNAGIAAYFESKDKYNNIESRAYVSDGNFGIRAYGESAGGFFYDTNDYTRTYISYSDYSVLGYGKVRGSQLCAGNNCQGGFQALVSSTSDTTTKYSWTTVVDNKFAVGDGIYKSGYKYVNLDSNKPVLAIRMSGYADDTGMCLVSIDDYFAGYITNNAYIDKLSYNSWSIYAWNKGSGNMLTTTFYLDDLNSGLILNDVGVYKPDTWGYLKPIGLSYIPAGKTLSYYQYYRRGSYNTCKIEVLYGEYK